MRHISLFILATASSAFAAVDRTPISLEEQTQKASVIVVGKIRTLEGKRFLKNGDFAIETEIIFTDVLKGNPRNPLIVHWEHHLAKGLERIPLHEPALWFLERRGKQKMLFATRAESRQPLGLKERVVQISAEAKK